MAASDYVSFPAAANGLSRTSNATAWVHSTWIELFPDSQFPSTDVAIVGVDCSIGSVVTADTTIEFLMELGTGTAGSEVTKVQIPWSLRSDTSANYFLGIADRFLWLPEPFKVPAGTRVAVRIASSAASFVNNGISVHIRELSSGQTITLTPATETDSAVALTFTKTIFKDLTAATETDSAVALSIAKLVTLLAATETDAAVAITFAQGGGPISVTLIPATEADAAQALSAAKQVTIVPATESDLAVALSQFKSVTLSPATELDTAIVLAITKTIFKTLIPALETDTAVALTFTGGAAQPVTVMIRKWQLSRPGWY